MKRYRVNALARCNDGSAPTELRRDELEDTVDDVGVVLHTELIEDGQEQRIGFRDASSFAS